MCKVESRFKKESQFNKDFLVHKLFDLRNIFLGLVFDLRKIFSQKVEKIGTFWQF